MKRIELLLTTTSPLHIASGEQGYRADPTKPYAVRDTRDNATGTFPVTTVFKMRVPVPPQNEAGEYDGEAASRGGTIRIPAISPNNLRGRLRRMGARAVFEAIQARGQKISLDTYHGMMCGAVTAQPSGSLTVSEAMTAGRHPFLGVFGGGPRLVQSAHTTTTLYPVTPQVLDLGLVPRIHADRSVGEKVGDLTQIIYFRRCDDALMFSDSYTQIIVEDYAKSVEVWQDLLEGRARKKKSAEASEDEQKKMSLQGFSAIEVVPPNVTFSGILTLDDDLVGKIGWGLYLDAIRRFGVGQRLGGWSRNGFGGFTLTASLIGSNGRRQSLFAPGENGCELATSDPEIKDALAAWADYAAKIEAGELEEFYRLEKK